MVNIDGQLSDFEKGRQSAIKEIIQESYSFECCPNCGNTDLDDDHFCKECKSRFAVAYDAGWFGQFLEKKYRHKD